MIIAAQIVGGLLLLFLGGEALVRGAVSLAEKLGISTLIIGLTIIAYGTSMPELVLSAEAALTGHPDIAIGNVVGSNISNIFLVLGASALIYPIMCNAVLLKREAPLLILLNLLLIGFCFTGVLNFIYGLIFLVVTTAYTWYIFYVAKLTNNEIPEHQKEEIKEQLKVKPSYKIAIIYIPIGIAMLIYGAHILVEGSSELARIVGVSEVFIGVTIAALGSSAPELVTAIVAAIHKHTDVAIGNILGSCLFNIMGILGVVPLLADLEVHPQFLDFDLWVMLGSALLLAGFMYFRERIGWLEGLICVVLYVAYITSQFFVG